MKKTVNYSLLFITTLLLNQLIIAQIYNADDDQKEKIDKVLQDYKTSELYTEETPINIAGKWVGREIHYDKTRSFIMGKYDVEIVFQQDGNRITGTSSIQHQFEGDKDHASMRLRGFIINNKLHYEEYEVLEETSDAYSVWCYLKADLNIEIKNREIYLVGKDIGYTIDNLERCDGESFFSLSQVRSDAPIAIKTAESNPSLSDKETQDLSIASATLEKEHIERIEGYQKSQIDAMNVYPNPFKENITVEYTVNASGYVKVSLFDLSGKQIEILQNGWREAKGTYRKNFDIQGQLPQGAYILRVSLNGEVQSSTVVKM